MNINFLFKSTSVMFPNAIRKTSPLSKVTLIPANIPHPEVPTENLRRHNNG